MIIYSSRLFLYNVQCVKLVVKLCENVGLVNTFGAVQGFIGVYVAGYLLQTFHTWSSVFHSTAAISFIGAVFYLTFASGERVI